MFNRYHAENSHLDEIILRLTRVLKKNEEPLALHEPEFSDLDKDLVLDCINSGWVSSVGKYVDQFESDIARFCGSSHAIAVVNGTAALQLAMRVIGVLPGDEVIMPTMTFVATANAALALKADPHFVDISEQTLGIDPHKLRSYLKEMTVIRSGITFNVKTGKRISCIVPTHVFGHPVDMTELMKTAADFNLDVVEDASEALGTTFKGQHVGSFGKVGVLSFNGNKIMTTGGGGALLISDNELARKARHLATTAKVPHPWLFNHDEHGYNFRMPNINAALGVAQLKQIQDKLRRKRKLASGYIKAFRDYGLVYIFEEPVHAKSNYWLNTLVLDSQNRAFDRDKLIAGLNQRGYLVRPVWNLMHSLSFLKGFPRSDLSVAEKLEKRLVNLPSSPNLAD